MIVQRIAARLLYGTLAVAILIYPLASPSTAQTPDSGQAAVRAALMKWTEDFNAGNVEAVCGLFSTDLLYDYRGYPERSYKDVCDVLRHSLTDPTKRYAYALAIKDILVSGDLAVVRLIWTLTVTNSGNQTVTVSQEYGIDVFRREADGRWRIVRFIAYKSPG